MTSLRTIGILGGMGPQATIYLQERLLAAIDAKDDEDHIPLLVDMNPQVPSRIKWLLEGGDQDPGPTLVRMAKRLEAAGVEALAMPCNTAHAFAPDIERSVSIPFIHMPKLAVLQSASHVGGGAGIGILASPATQQTGLFSNELANHHLHALYPADQGLMLQAIKKIKAVGPDDGSLAVLDKCAAELKSQGAQAIIVGCSEFSLLSDRISAGVAIIDTLDVLVSYLVSFAMNGATAAPDARAAPP